MIYFLATIFISKNKNHTPQSARQAYGLLCGAVGIALNLLLTGGKLAAGLISGSIAITADALNNLSDAASSFITLMGFKLSGHKPDKDHPFGHGRIEYISGLLVALLIMLMAVELLKSSLSKILHPQLPQFSLPVLFILLASIGVKLYMAFYNHSFGKKLNSASMHATAIDSLSDCAATSAVLVSMLISHFWGLALDGWCGILVGLFVFYAGIRAAKDTIDPLLGQAPDDELVERIRSLVLSHEEILGIHDLMVHNYGPGQTLISLHVEVSSKGDLIYLHDKIDLIEHQLRKELGCNAVIHMDPVLVGDAMTDALRRETQYHLDSLGEHLSLHDFRLVQRPSHINIAFDVEVPYHFAMSDSEIISHIGSLLEEAHPGYLTIIEIDRK